jgi:hypothetical protein
MVTRHRGSALCARNAAGRSVGSATGSERSGRDGLHHTLGYGEAPKST